MSEEYRNGYSRKVYSHRRQERRSSPVPLFDQVFGMGKPVLRDYDQAIDLSVKKVKVENAETTKTNASKDRVKTTKKIPIFSSSSTDDNEDEMLDLLSERSSLCSDANAEEISDRELSLIRAHMSNIESEDTRCSSQSLTVTFVLTSATDSSSSSATDSFQPVEMPRQSTNAPEIGVYSLANLSTDVVKEDEKGYESPQEVYDLSGSGLDADEIRSSTPVNNSQIQLQLFDSLSTIADLQNNRERDEEDEVKEAEIIADNEEDLEEDEEVEQELEEEEESVSYAAQNEKTPPRSNKHGACPSISLKHSLRNGKKDRSKKLRSSRCIFPEESMQEQVPVTQSLELTQQESKKLIDCPVGMRQLTSTPISSIGNNDNNYLPHPALSTITMFEPQDSSTAVEPNGEEARLEMSVPNENQEKQDLGIRDHFASHKQLTSTPVSFLKCKIDSCLPPAVSIITILEPRHCIHSTELESEVGVAEPDSGLLATRNQETTELCRPSLAARSSEGRITWKSDCGRLAKRSRISSDETGSPEKVKSKSLLKLPVLKPSYIVEPDRWNIPYKTTDGQICEHKDLELCSIVRLPFVEDNPVHLLQCVVEKNAVTSCSPDFLESF